MSTETITDTRVSKRLKTNDSETLPEPSSKENEISYVEFYSGIGGWTMALEEALHRLPADQKLHLRRIAALDHSNLCTSVFQHNFGADENSTSIERLSLKRVEEWCATIWAMSPPCQPHTRQHSNQAEDLNDPRSASFLHLCTLLDTMKDKCLPLILLLENVVGFESSRSFERWQNVLSNRRYQIGHFHLTPTQVGLPNDRPRYFCVAVKQSALPDASADSNCNKLLSYLQARGVSDDKNPVGEICTEIPELAVKAVGETGELATIASMLDEGTDPSLAIPEKILKSNSAWCFDIVCPLDRRSSCFTQSYGRYVKGTGSILYMDPGRQLELLPPQEREFNADWAQDLDFAKLRYFSGAELARLMGFCKRFSFPAGCTNKQQWKLIGNSLNVQVASRVVELGMRVLKGLPRCGK